ncbi:MAG: diacylglycerol/lipid kinase family protein [Alphaproteobacteria bacterium]
MNRLAIISNPKSHRNLHGPATLRDVAACAHLAGFAEPETQTDLLAVLTRFKQQDVNVIAINGGDGTVRDVLTGLWRVDPEWRPALTIIPGGKTNLAAYDVGSARHGPAGLQQVLDAARKGELDRKRVHRPILEISRKDCPGAPICGLFFGAGAFSAGTELAQTEANALGLYHGLAVAWTIASMLVRNIRGPAGDSTSMVLTADGGKICEGEQFIMLATSLQRIILGLNPFWGPQGGAVRYTAINGPPKSLAAALLPVLRGRPRPWMEAAGYRSGSADRLTLRLTSRFTVDGELFDPGPSGLIELSARRTVDFVHP